MALDSSYVYWVGGTTPGPDGVMRMPKAGGVVTTLVANELAPYGIAVDATSVYYTTTYSSTSSPGIVKKVPLDGSSPPTALLFQRAWGLALSGTTLLLGTGDIEAMPTTGGSVTLLALGQNGPFAVAADASNVYWVTPPPDGGVVASVPITGGTVTTLATGQNGGPYGLDRGIAVDASNVYVTNNTGGTVVSVPKTGGGGVTTLASGQASPWSVAVAGGYVYWTNNASNGPGSVMKVPVGGAAPPTAIATGQSQPWGIAVDDPYVYWTNSGAGAGAVMKTAR
jgi:hypothetical protein